MKQPKLVWATRHKLTKKQAKDLEGFDVVQTAYRYTSWQEATMDILFAAGGTPDVVVFVIGRDLSHGFVRHLRSRLPHALLLRAWEIDGEIWYVRMDYVEKHIVLTPNFDLCAYLAERTAP